MHTSPALICLFPVDLCRPHTSTRCFAIFSFPASAFDLYIVRLRPMAQSQNEKDAAREIDHELKMPDEVAYGELINASGHIQEVDRNFGLLSLVGFGIVNGNVWPALGASILVAIFNGGPPGTIYEL